MEIWTYIRQGARLVAAHMRSERAATAVEYSLMVALIAAVIITAVVFLGQSTKSSFDCVGKSLPKGAPVPGC